MTTTPPVSIALAGPEDAEGAVDLHNRHFGTRRRVEFWRWKYVDSVPDKAVFVVARSGQRVVGTQGVIPVRLNAGGRVRLSGKSENSLVAPGFRRHRLWHRMYRHALAGCRARGIDCIWGFTPVRAARLGLERLGFTVHDVLVQAVACLNLAAGLRAARQSGGPLRRILHTLCLPLLWAVTRISRWRHAAPATDLHYGTTAPSPAELADLYARLRERHPGLVHLELDPAYLDWRIGRHPHFRYAWRTARRSGRLAAYLLLNHDRIGSETAGSPAARPAIVDFACDDGQSGAGLLNHVLTELAALGAGVVMLVANRLNPLGRQLLAITRGFGFVHRPATSSFVLRPADATPDTTRSSTPGNLQSAFCCLQSDCSCCLPTRPEPWLLSLLWFEGYAV